jgi:hypothetical protein
MSAPGTMTLFALPDGGLAIRRTPVAGSSVNRYDLIDRRGELQGVIQLPLNEAIIGFGRSSVYVLEAENTGVQRVRRHKWGNGVD